MDGCARIFLEKVKDSFISPKQIHLRGRGELLEFVALLLAAGLADVAFGREFGFFEVHQDLLRAFQHFFRHAGEARDLDAVAFVCAAFDDLAQEHNRVVPLAHGDVVILDARQALGEFGQFVIVRGEQRFRTDLIVQVFNDAPREAQAVECARATTDFVEDDEAARRGIVEDVGGLAHLDHERGLPARQIIARADARKDAVHEINARFLRGNKTAGVREQREQRHLPDVSGFARHVRPGYQSDLGRVLSLES